ncbi:MAG TPA: phospholipid carrier-dependent glycosyltransferase, partial [Allocoleopsis sp.]
MESRLSSRLLSLQTLGLAFLILIISYFTYFHGYDKPQAVFWDENYYLASSQKYLNRIFFMHEHPPLGQMLIALGEKLLHGNS